MSNDVQVAFRFPAELVARLDDYAAKMRTSNAGVRISRADAARLLLNQALAAVDNSPERTARRKRT